MRMALLLPFLFILCLSTSFVASHPNSRIATLSPHEFPIHHPNKRVIIIGDIHGMSTSLTHLLDKLAYSPDKDTLIHVGDILTKGSHKGSMQVLSFMAAQNATGVRGNHDQTIIEWRTWIQWVESNPQGKKWLRELDARYDKFHKLGKDTKAWIRNEIAKLPSAWARRIPKPSDLFKEHHRIARQLSTQEYNYLVSLPNILHIPSEHTFIVHAGILSSDPRYGPNNHHQPLSKMPVFLQGHKQHPLPDQETLRILQEEAILKEIPFNQDPWVNLNMRSITSKGKISRKNRGQPWAELWNEDMNACDGFDPDFKRKKKPSLFCLPSTVIYGHSAARGLDVHRWSIGLDSGCIYGRHLTAMVLGGDPQFTVMEPGQDNPNFLHHDDDSTIPFGDKGSGKLISVKCHKES